MGGVSAYYLEGTTRPNTEAVTVRLKGTAPSITQEEPFDLWAPLDCGKAQGIFKTVYCDP